VRSHHKKYEGEKRYKQNRKTNLETDTTEVMPGILNMIKHPAKIDDTIGDLPSNRLKDNQALVPETLRESGNHTNTLENTKQIAPINTPYSSPYSSAFLCANLRASLR
jgi:hypothetical protein